MKKLILILSLLFSLFMSMSVFAADYSIGSASWDVGDKALATWDETEDKTKYKVQLYKGNKKVGSNNAASSEKYDFTKLIIDNGAGNYHFKVYPLKGGPSMAVDSDIENFDYDAIAEYKKKRSGTTPNSNNTNSTTSTGTNNATVTGWYQTNNTWHYRKADGTHATNWFMVNNLWYFFDANGNMLTGWIENNGNKYYLNQPNGDMPVGWALINDKWYYFEESGLYKKGWIEYKGHWYYLDANGQMVTNTTIDGYNINQDGVWVQ